MNKNREKLHWHRSLVVTVILILLMVAASFVITGWISREEEERSFTRLRQEAGQVAGRIEEMTETDRAQLEEIATVVARYGDFMDAQMWDLLDSYVAPGMISRLELLLPDDTLLATGGRREETGGQISFAEEAAQGEHISAREKDFKEDGGYVVRHYVPVIRNGETVAMISGVVELADLPNTIGMEPYEGQAALYLIEGETGDFRMDTWHGETGGNIWALGERKMAPGYDHETLKEGLTEGRTAYVVFSSAREIQNLFRVFLAFEVICFFLYFLWMVFYVRSVTDEKQRQLDTIHHIYDVDKLLFNAHENRQNLN